MVDLEDQTQSAFGGASGSWEDKPLTPASVPEFERPMMAAEDDFWTGITDELGNRQYSTKTGQTYFVSLNPDQRTTRTKVEEDVVPAVKDYLKDPKLPSKEQALGFGKAVAEGAYNSLDAAVTGTGTLGDVYGAAGMAATGGLSGTVPKDALRIFGGRRARDPGKLSGSIDAPESIGADNLWRFEIPDNTAKIKTENFQTIDGKAQDPQQVKSTLAEVLDHPELFRQYPVLKDQKIFLDRSLKGTSTLGYHDNVKGVMALNPDLLNSPDRTLSVLLHEIQHPIQQLEGFSTGTNMRSSEIEGPAKNISQKRVKKAKEIDAEYKANLEQYQNFDFEEGYLKFEDKLRDFVDKVGIDWQALLTNEVPASSDLWNLQWTARKSVEDYWDFRQKNSLGDKFAKSGLANNLSYRLTSLAELAKKDPTFLKAFEDVFKVSPSNILPEKGQTKDFMALSRAQKQALEDLGVIKVEPKNPRVDTRERVTLFDREESYRSKSGEVEARNVQARKDLTLEERLATKPEVTEDVPRADQWQSGERPESNMNKAEGGLITFAEGGLAENTMEQQMNKLFAEGGINTGTPRLTR
jgi:hypothetical protein